MATPPKYVTLNGETLTQVEWAAKIGISPNLFRWRLRTLKAEKLPLGKVADNEFWRQRRLRIPRHNRSHKINTSRGDLTLQEIADIAGVTKGAVKSRYYILKKLGKSFDLLFDNTFWANRKRKKGSYKRIKKVKRVFSQKDMARKAEKMLYTIPTPSKVEIMMEKKGWL